jgi:GT2 family glycosyltransferase
MLSISLVLYNTSQEDISRLVCESLNLDYLVNFYLIDNSPEPQKISFNDERVRYIFNGQNLGYGKGHNIALRESISRKTQYHIVLNPDIYFDARDMYKIIEFLNENKEVAHLMPNIVNQSGEMQFLSKTLPSPVDVFLRAFAKKYISTKRDVRFHLKTMDHQKIMWSPYLSGCFMVFRTEVLSKVGVFDERFFMYPEDIDLTRRIAMHHKTIFYPYVTVIHRHEKASYKSLKMKWIHIYNMMKYFNKYGWFWDVERKKLNQAALNQVQ